MSHVRFCLHFKEKVLSYHFVFQLLLYFYFTFTFSNVLETLEHPSDLFHRSHCTYLNFCQTRTLAYSFCKVALDFQNHHNAYYSNFIENLSRVLLAEFEFHWEFIKGLIGRWNSLSQMILWIRFYVMSRMTFTRL